MFMKRNFLPQFFYCVGKISLNHNITSFNSIIFYIIITQSVTSLCIITFQKNFLNLKSTHYITLKYPGLHIKYFLHIGECSFFLIIFRYYMLQKKQFNRHPCSKRQCCVICVSSKLNISAKDLYCYFNSSSQCNQQNFGQNFVSYTL